MIPSMDIHKQFMFEHVRELQREAEQERMLAGQRKPYHSLVRYLIACLSTFFVVSVTSMQQLEQPDHPTGVYEHKTARLVERTGA